MIQLYQNVKKNIEVLIFLVDFELLSILLFYNYNFIKK